MCTHKIIFVANNHGNQKYTESYRNDFNTWLKALGIVSNEIYRHRPSLAQARKHASLQAYCIYKEGFWD